MAKFSRTGQILCILVAAASLLTACGSPAATAQPAQPTTDRFANATPAQGAAGPNSPGESSAGGNTNNDPNIATLAPTTGSGTTTGAATAGSTTVAAVATAGGTLTTLTAAAIGSSAPTVTGALITPNTSSTKAGTTGAATAGVNAPAGATMAPTMSATTGATSGAAPVSANGTMAATASMNATSGSGTTGTMAATSASPCPVQRTPMGTMGATMSATMNSTMSATTGANTNATVAIPVTGTANATGVGSASAGGAYLGIVGQTVPGCGILITEIRAGSAAQVDRLQVGDIIISVDNQTVQSNENLAAILSRHAASDRIQITVLRNNQPLQIGVTLMTAAAGTVTVPANVTPLGTSEPPAR